MLLSTFTKTSVGYALTISLNPSELSTGYDSYDLAIKFDPTVVKLANTSYDFPGELKSVNETLLSTGVLSASGLTLTARIAAATPIVTLNFVKDGSAAFAVKVTKLNVNGSTYISDTSPVTLTSPGNSDTVAPTVQSSDPSSSGIAALDKAYLTVTFSEAIARGTGLILLKTAAGETVESFDVAAAGRVSISGSTLSIDPAVNLVAGTSYVLSVPAGSIKDTSGNSLASAYSVSFSGALPDTTAPTLQSSDPSSGGTVAVDKSFLSVSFSESIARGTGLVVLKTAAGDTVESFDVTSTSGVYVSGSTLSVDPTANLVAGTSYVLSAPAGVVKDTAGNSLASSYSVSFSTAALADSTAPTVQSSDPSSNAIVAIDKALLSLTFSETIVRGTGLVLLQTAAGVTVESFDLSSAARVSISGSTLSVDPAVSLVGGTSYVLSLPAGAVKDASGNTLASSYSVSFVTSSPDYTAPVVSSLSPVANATGIATSASIYVQFSEAVTLNAGAIQLLKTDGSVVESFNAASSDALIVSGDTLTITPTTALTAGTSYRVSIPSTAIKDLSGNSFAGLSGYGFKTYTPVATDLSLVADKTSVNEGGTLTFSFSASTRQSGSSLAYEIEGVNVSDVKHALTGTLTLGSGKTAQLTLKITQDALSEGAESLKLSVEGVSTTVTINDTSTSPLPQSLTGTTNSETFKLTNAVDKVNGGDGVDSVYVNGDSSDFDIVVENGKVYLSQQSSLNIDTLQSIERIEFSDLSVSLDTAGSSGIAYRLYKAAFNREPDLEGIGYWMAALDSGKDTIAAAADFVYSAEFQSVYGVNPTNSEFLLKLYNNVLGRDPDEEGFNWWLEQMNSGTSYTMAKVLANFSESTENKSVVADLIGNGIEYAPWLG